jgi:hypothetical protein
MAAYTATLDDSRKTVLSNQERAMGFTHKYTIKYTDIDDDSATSTGDTVTVALGNTPTDFVITKAMVNVTTAFAGGGTLTIDVGTDGDANNFINLKSVTAVGPIIELAGAAPVTVAGTFAATADALEAHFINSSSSNPAALSAGELDIYLGMVSANNIG